MKEQASGELATFGDRLRWTLSRYNGTQGDFHRAHEIPRATVGKWFRGAVSDVESRHLWLIAEECRVNPEWLSVGRGPVSAAKRRESVPQLSPVQSDILRAIGALPFRAQARLRELLVELTREAE